MLVSYVIPLRLDTVERVENFRFVWRYLGLFPRLFPTGTLSVHRVAVHLDNAPSLPEAESVLEWAAHQPDAGNTVVRGLSDLYANESPAPFAQARLGNLGSHLCPSETEIVSFYDADVFASPEAIRSLLGTFLEQSGAVMGLPFNSPLYDVPRALFPDCFTSESHPVRQLWKLDDFCRATTLPPRKPHINYGCAFHFRKSYLERIGGYDDEFYGWGAEDEELFIRSQRRLAKGEFIFRVPERLFHLWHPRGPNSSTASTHFERNLCRRQALESMTDLHLERVHVPSLVRKYQDGKNLLDKYLKSGMIRMIK